MPDAKISALTAITTLTPATDVLPVVDVTGTTKKITTNQILGSGGTATLASATITGDLTVDTSTLKVDSANNVVGIGTASPTAIAGYTSLTINTPTTGSFIDLNVAGVNKTRLLGTSSNFNIETAGTIPITMMIGGQNQYRVDTAGVFTWYDGAGGTRMTLNANGLGVGASPSFKFHVQQTLAGTASAVNPLAYIVNNGSGNTAKLTLSDAVTTDGNITLTGSATAANRLLGFGINGVQQMVLDGNGNVGIGVTPSAWAAGFKVLQVGSGPSISTNGNASRCDISTNYYYNGGNKFLTASGYATGISQENGNFYFQRSTTTSGGIGSSLTFDVPMTLDASGRLGVGVVPASNVRTHFKGSSTSTDFINQCINNSNALAFGIRNDGLLITGSLADVATLPSSPYNLTTGSAANVFVDSQGIFYRSTSSLKYKTDIADSTRGLADVLKLRPVTYKAKNSGDTVFGGLIAEEVDAAGLTEFVQYAPDNTPDAIHYGNMVSLLVAAIKELTARVQTLETR